MKLEVNISGIELKTKRLLLREFKSSDLDDFYEYASVEGVGEMAGWHHHTDKDVSKQILETFIQGKCTFAIEYNGKVVGSVGIEKYRENMDSLGMKKGRDIGFVIAKDCWGKGLMPEAVSAVIQYLFEKVGADYVSCGHFDSNNQSARVQEKLGFDYYMTTTMTTIMGTTETMIINVLTKRKWREMRELSKR